MFLRLQPSAHDRCSPVSLFGRQVALVFAASLDLRNTLVSFPHVCIQDARLISFSTAIVIISQLTFLFDRNDQTQNAVDCVPLSTARPLLDSALNKYCFSERPNAPSGADNPEES